MRHRMLGPSLQVSAMGLGCMGMSEFYGPRNDNDRESLAVLRRAVDLGIGFLDTADMYGSHHNEELIGRFLAESRPNIKIATKFGIVREPGEYARSIDNSTDYMRRACEGSLKRLGIDRIDLYYVHRIDRKHPIEETMEGLADLKRAGKIAHIELCEVSAETLRRAHAVHPVTAVQTEYSLWTRDVESEILPACCELGSGFVAYSPLGRGFLTGRFQAGTQFEDGDFRAGMPHFAPKNAVANIALVDVVHGIAAAKGCTPAQVALAWLLGKGDDIVPIPGTKRLKYLEENTAAASVTLSAEELTSLDRSIAAIPMAGNRYTAEGRGSTHDTGPPHKGSCTS